jgi:hypothetical protein
MIIHWRGLTKPGQILPLGCASARLGGTIDRRFAEPARFVRTDGT